MVVNDKRRDLRADQARCCWAPSLGALIRDWRAQRSQPVTAHAELAPAIVLASVLSSAWIHIMSRTPTSPPLTPTRLTHTRTPNSPLRPNSPTPPRPASGPPLVTPRRVSHNGPATPTTSTPPGQKTRARDLLRKHYGLTVGPPGAAKSPADPMDLGASCLPRTCE